MNSARKGKLSELKAQQWLLEQGYEVFPNISPEGPFDLVALKDGELVCIDVKTASVGVDFGVKTLIAARKFRKSADKYPDVTKKLLYVYKDQVSWQLGKLIPDWPPGE